MRFLIWHKIFLALLAATSVVVLVALVLTRWSFNQGFLDYVNAVENDRIATVAESLLDIYAETQNWDSLLNEPRRWRTLMDNYAGRPATGLRPPPERGFRRSPPNRRGPGRPEFAGGRPRPPTSLLGTPQPLDLLDVNRQSLIGKPDERPEAALYPLEFAGSTVGYIRYLPVNQLTDLDNAAEQQFIKQQRAALALTGAVALLTAALLAIIFGRRLVAPVKVLAAGTKELASGKLAQPIPVTTRDELGELAESFNAMAASLQQARQTQQQWIADIAHELRTPLAILTGELQAIEDGVREWNVTTQASLQAEIDRLTGLVSDLHEVSLSEAGGLNYQRREIELLSIIERAADSHRARIEECGLSLQLELPQQELALRGDARRLEQVITNLLENSCRYTDAGGTIRLSCRADNPVTLIIEDSAPGVPADALPKLFERLFRVEASRNRALGGSGLGLAICKGIIEAHGGVIDASPSELGGLAIRIELPRDHA
jgi:two-component system sensor histidine kinase BaeS